MDNELKTNNEYYEDLYDDELKDMFNNYSKRIKNCPDCNNCEYVSVIVVGRPSDSLCDLADETKIVRLDGCLLQMDQPDFYCRKCDIEYKK